MKLLTKTNRYYLRYSALLLACGVVLFYFIINGVIRSEVSELLENQLEEYLIESRQNETSPIIQSTSELEVSLAKKVEKPDVLIDTLIKEPSEDELIPYLQLSVYREINGRYYHITLRESLIESEDILLAITLSLVLLFAVLLVGLYLLNKHLSKELWKPFYLNLEQVKQFNLTQMEDMSIIDADITEFQELNDALIKMASKSKKDYLSLKQFTENASHEIQTPLAIIRSNIDQLMQYDNDETRLNDLSKIEMAVNRILKINQGLLLLAKIENRQFKELEKLNLVEYLQQSLSDFEELSSAKNLSIHLESKNEHILFNKSLLIVLLNNVIGNAIRHNQDNGFIKIRFMANTLTIENSGKPLTVDPSTLFNRFVKSNPSAQSTGLGLAIVKTIGDELGLDIDYKYYNSTHTITIKFH